MLTVVSDLEIEIGYLAKTLGNSLQIIKTHYLLMSTLLTTVIWLILFF